MQKKNYKKKPMLGKMLLACITILWIIVCTVSCGFGGNENGNYEDIIEDNNTEIVSKENVTNSDSFNADVDIEVDDNIFPTSDSDDEFNDTYQFIKTQDLSGYNDNQYYLMYRSADLSNMPTDDEQYYVEVYYPDGSLAYYESDVFVSIPTYVDGKYSNGDTITFCKDEVNDEYVTYDIDKYGRPIVVSEDGNTSNMSSWSNKTLLYDDVQDRTYITDCWDDYQYMYTYRRVYKGVIRFLPYCENVEDWLENGMDFSFEYNSDGYITDINTDIGDPFECYIDLPENYDGFLP